MYLYMQQLLQLEQCRRGGEVEVAAQLRGVQSPLVASQWRFFLQHHPDKQFSGYVLTGITQGFRIGFDYRKAECSPVLSNLVSADNNPEVVTKYLEEEAILGRITERIIIFLGDLQENY